MRNKILFAFLIFYVIISNLIGREIGYLALLGRLKYIHIFLIIFLPLISLTSLKRIFIKNHLFLFVGMTSVGPFIGVLSGETLATHFNIVIILLFFVIAFQTFDNEKKYEVLINIFIISWIIIVIYKELLFLSYGTSMLFSFSNLRLIGDIRQSSDTINSLALLIAIYCFLVLKDQLQIRRFYYYFLLFLSLYVIMRYGIRGAYVTLIILLIIYFLNKRSLFRKRNKTMSVIFKLSFSVFILIIIYMLLNYDISSFGVSALSELTDNLTIEFDPQKKDAVITMLVRAAMWFDSIIYFFTQEFILINFSNRLMDVDYSISDMFSFTTYKHPHNSYIMLLTNYGLVPFILFIYIIYKILKKLYMYISTDFWMKYIYYSLVSYSILAMFTPIFELPYQGCIYWILAGIGVRRIELIKINKTFKEF